jgi:hypothetical protein
MEEPTAPTSGDAQIILLIDRQLLVRKENNALIVMCYPYLISSATTVNSSILLIQIITNYGFTPCADFYLF